MTAIKVFRAPETTEDRWGDEQPPEASTWPEWKMFDGDVSWLKGEESLEPRRDTVKQPREVYLELGEPCGVLPTDQVEVNGVRYNVVGKVAEWEEDGEHVGSHFRIIEVS